MNTSKSKKTDNQMIWILYLNYIHKTLLNHFIKYSIKAFS